MQPDAPASPGEQRRRQELLLQALRSGACFDHPTESIRIVETRSEISEADSAILARQRETSGSLTPEEVLATTTICNRSDREPDLAALA